MFDFKQGVTFGAYHSYNDWGLILESDEIGFPVASSDIDMLPIYGQDDFDPRVTWSRRELRFTFGVAHLTERWPDLIARITGAIQGKKIKVIRDCEAGYYYLGRCRVEAFERQLSIGHFSIVVDAEPYKIAVEPTVYNFSETKNLTLNYAGAFITPAVFSIVSTGAIVDYILTGAARDPNTLEKTAIKFASLSRRKTLVIDGINKTITVDGENKFADAELWNFPTLIPGQNEISASTTTTTTTITVYERAI